MRERNWVNAGADRRAAVRSDPGVGNRDRGRATEARSTRRVDALVFALLLGASTMGLAVGSMVGRYQGVGELRASQEEQSQKLGECVAALLLFSHELRPALTDETVARACGLRLEKVREVRALMLES